MQLSGKTRLSGFTLVELLVVITISSLAVALIGGVGVQEYKKYQMKAEQMELRSFARYASHRAFVFEEPYILKFSKQQVELTGLEKTNVNLISFRFLQFSDLSVSINQQGFYSQEQIRYRANDKSHTLNLVVRPE